MVVVVVVGKNNIVVSENDAGMSLKTSRVESWR